MISIIVDSVAGGAVLADYLPHRSIGALDFRPGHPSQLSRGRASQCQKRGGCPDHNSHDGPPRHSATGLVLEPKSCWTPTCRPLTSYLGNSSIPYLCSTARSIFEVRSVLSGKTIWRLPLNLPSSPPSKITGT